MTTTTRWFEAPTDGEAPDLAPDTLGPRQARSLRNFLVHHPGRIVPRGGIGGTGATEIGNLVDTTNGGALLSSAVYDDLIGVTYRAPSAGALVDNWRVPINRPTLAAQLAQPSLGATALRVVDVNTGTVTDIATAAATSVFGPSVTRMGDAFYSASFGGVSTAVPTGVAPLNAIRKADVTLGTGAVLTNGPRFVTAVFSHADRLWAAAARSPAGADYDTSKIFYTRPGGTTAFTDVATDWQDAVTGETNVFSIGSANDGDFVVGFGRAAGHLIVFKRNAVFVLYGTHPSNFTLRQLRTQSGCVDFRSICVADEGVYFASQLGYELFDGQEFRLLSEPITDSWLALSNAGAASGSTNHAYIRACALPNGYIYLALGTDATTANATDGTARGWLLHRGTHAWIDLRSGITSIGLGASGYLNRTVVTRSTVTAWGAAEWARCDGLTYGADSAVGVVDRDAGASYGVDLTWQTYLHGLGSSRGTDARWSSATLKRVTVDYKHSYTNSTPAELTAFGTLAAADGFGAALGSAQNVSGYRPPGPTRARELLSTHHETLRGDVSFTLASSIGSSSSLRTAALSVYGIGVEFSHGGDRLIA